MKSINLISILVALIAITFYSCEGNNLDIEKMINNKNNPITYVIESQVSNIVKKQHVFISKPGKISGSDNYESVHNAKVQISDGVNTWFFKELPENNEKYHDLYSPNSPKLITGGVYESEEYFAAKAGKTYTLTVTIKGEEFTAKETMPQAEKMTNEEFKILQNTDGFTTYIFGTTRNAIWTNSKDMFKFNSKENLTTVILGRINFFKRNYINDTQNSTSDGNILQPLNDKYLIIRRYTPSTEYYNYIWAYAFGKGSNALSVEQNRHPSNFNNSKVGGYFSAINCSQYQANMQEYKEQFTSYFDKAKTFKANYKDKGEFVLSMNANGYCELEGMGKKLIGAYDIVNNKQVRVYFTSKYTKVPKYLYHFYEVTLKQAFVITPLPNPMYRSLENAIFTIQNDGSIKAQDGTVWK